VLWSTKDAKSSKLSAPLYELRAARDDFELRGQPARAALAEVVSRFPTDSGCPELARAEVALKLSNRNSGSSAFGNG
jgi:hypothetical protein